MSNMKFDINTLLLICAAVMAVLILWAIFLEAMDKRKQRKRKEERRYQEARAIARDFINTQISYNDSVRTIDNATIEAFEKMIAEIAKYRNGHQD